MDLTKNYEYKLRTHPMRATSRVQAYYLRVLFFAALLSVRAFAEPISVQYLQGAGHGFVVVKTLDGRSIGVGDVTQTVRGNRVTSRTIIRFRDGSVDDDTTVYSQRGVFQLISDHHLQHGPMFPKATDVLINGLTGQITYRNKDAEKKEEHLDLPADISNGLPPNLLLNIRPTTPETKLSFVIPGSKPRLIHVSVKPAGLVPFTIGGVPRKATDFILHIELGGIKGVIAPMLGKDPVDYHIWILAGNPPAFIREEGPLYEGGPILRIESISPAFPH